MIGLQRSRAALFVVDIQEKLVPVMHAHVAQQAIRNTCVLIETAAKLGLPVVVSQQYPKGLGTTVKPIEDALAGVKTVHRFDKSAFSAAATPEFAALAPTLRRDQWIVAGMEAHICVYQTARDLAVRGYQTHVVADAISSRTEDNWNIGCNLIERAGGIITSTEVVVFDLLGHAGTDEFKALSRLIK